MTLRQLWPDYWTNSYFSWAINTGVFLSCLSVSLSVAMWHWPGSMRPTKLPGKEAIAYDTISDTIRAASVTSLSWPSNTSPLHQNWNQDRSEKSCLWFPLIPSWLHANRSDSDCPGSYQGRRSNALSVKTDDLPLLHLILPPLPQLSSSATWLKSPHAKLS